MAIRKKQSSSNSGLGFIDLLAITLVVIILQTVAILDRADDVTPPQPVTYIVSVYQPPETARASSVADHLEFIRVGVHILFWSPERGVPFRYFRDTSHPDGWSVAADFGMAAKPIPFYRGSNADAIANYSEAVFEEYGIELTITEIDGRPPRLTFSFDDTIGPAEIEVAFEKCHASDSPLNKYLSRYLHPVLVKWSVLGENVHPGDTGPLEISKHNGSEWAGSGQFSLSQVSNSCNSSLDNCVRNAPQSHTYISTDIEFTGSSLVITDSHGTVHNAG